MKQYSKLPKWATHTIIVTAATLILSSILSVLTPEEKIVSTPLISTNYNQTSSEFSNLTYVGSGIEIPTSLNISQVTIVDYEEELRSKLIKKFSLKQIQDFDVWTSNDWALTVEKNGDFFNISNQGLDKKLGGSITLDAATATAWEFLNQYLPQYRVVSLANQAEFFEDQFGEPAKTTASKAKIIKVAFGYSIENYPVFYENNVNNFIEVYVDSNKNIRRASFSTSGISLKNIETKTTLSPQMALQLANQDNKAAIINIGYESPTELNFDNIISGKFKSVSIEYRVDPDQNLAYPFYRFEGILVDNNYQEFSGEVIAPAIETTVNQ